MVRWSRVGTWWLLACLGPLLAALGVALVGGGPLVTTALYAGAMWAPTLASVVMDRRWPPTEPLGWAPRPSRWWGVASVLALVVSGATLLVGLALPGASFDPGMEATFAQLALRLPADQVQAARDQVASLPVHPVILGIPQAVVAGLTINALFAFGEEQGWRGWLYRELAPLGFWRSMGVTGVLWGLWHAPLILQGHNYPTERVPGVFLFTLVCVGLAVIHGQIRERSGSVWPAAVLHGTINASAGLATMVVAGPELWVGVPGVAGLAVLVAMTVGVAAWRWISPSAT